jgi:hypothetical protein
MSAISSGELKEVCDERGLLYSSMILPDNIVEVFALSQPREMLQPASTLHLCGGTRVGRVFVDGDRAQIAGMNLRQCLAKEMLSRGGVPPVLSELAPERRFAGSSRRRKMEGDGMDS